MQNFIMQKKKLKAPFEAQFETSFETWSLEALAEKIKRCKKCRLWKTRNKAVPGEGNGKARLMIIGQAPGKQEDKTGRPFVGRAGFFLMNALKKFGKKRGDFFITSVLKCFPPKNRKPKQDELAACLPYTLQQIAIIKPKAILLLGEIATKAILKKDFKTVRGKFVKFEGGVGIKNIHSICFVTYHPAMAMRFPDARKIFFADLKNFFKKLKKSNKKLSQEK